MKNKPTKKLSGRSAEEWQESLWDKFLDNLLKIKSRQELKKTITGLFSAQEKSFIVRRLATMELLKTGSSYQEIGEILWISPSTISAIKKHLINQGHIYKGSGALKKEKLKFEKISKKDFSSNGSIEWNDYFSRRVRRGK